MPFGPWLKNVNFNHFPKGHNEPATEVKQVKNIICYEQQNWGFKSLLNNRADIKWPEYYTIQR